MKRPAMQSCSLSASGRYPFADTLEIFQGDSTSGALRLLHECLADLVVDVSPKTSLFAGNLFELPLGSLRLFLLKVPATVGVPSPYLLNPFARICVSIRVCGKVDNSQIDTEEIVWGLRSFLFDNTGDEKKPLARLCANEIHLSRTVLQHLALTVAALEGHFHAAFKCPDGDMGSTPRQNAWIIRLGPVSPELPGFASLADSMGGSNLGDAPDGGLGTESEAGAYFAVHRLLNGHLVKHPEGNGLFGDPRARLVAPLQSHLKEGVLILRREKPDLHDEVHAVSLHEDETGCKPVSEGQACRLRTARPFGLCDQIPEGLHHRSCGDGVGEKLHKGLRGLRCGFGGSRLGGGSCPSADFVPAEGCAVRPGQFAQGGQQPETPRAWIQGSRRCPVGEGFLVSELLRSVLWRGASRKDKGVC